MSNIIVQGNEINAKQYIEKITIEGIGEEKTLNPRIVVASGGGNSMINYSTEEQVIGTWIDGKPLYQKTIVKNNIYVGSRGGTSGRINHEVDNIGVAVSLKMACPILGISSGDILCTTNSVPIPFRVDDTAIYSANPNADNFGATADRYWYFTIQYTKTTD